MKEIRILVECEDAGLTHPCEGEVTLTTCPYDEDLHGIVTPVWICAAHYEERARGL